LGRWSAAAKTRHHSLNELGDMLTHVVKHMATKDDIANVQADIARVQEQVNSIETELRYGRYEQRLGKLEEKVFGSARR
jgi:ribosome-interacting GTPase 1